MEQFDVLQTLGKGSFGVVRKVRRKADGKTLVVKEMDYGAADEKQKEQIVAEVRAELHYLYCTCTAVDPEVGRSVANLCCEFKKKTFNRRTNKGTGIVPPTAAGASLAVRVVQSPLLL